MICDYHVAITSLAYEEDGLSLWEPPQSLTTTTLQVFSHSRCGLASSLIHCDLQGRLSRHPRRHMHRRLRILELRARHRHLRHPTHLRLALSGRALLLLGSGCRYQLVAHVREYTGCGDGGEAGFVPSAVRRKGMEPWCSLRLCKRYRLDISYVYLTLFIRVELFSGSIFRENQAGHVSAVYTLISTAVTTVLQIMCLNWGLKVV
jgi:hypothetical protein